MTFLTQFLWSQFFGTPPYPTADWTGRTVIATGSNVGLGFEAARHFARLNCAKLILAVRTLSKGQTAKEEILRSTKRTSDVIEVWELDLSSTASVKAFAKRVQSLDRVDAIIENAGINTENYKLHEGFESTIQTNVIQTFLLALLVLPKLRETGQRYSITTHLEIVSSEVHHLTTLPEADTPDVFATLNDEEHHKKTARTRYAVSKALEVLFVRELVKNLRSKNPIVTMVNPGLCQSTLTRDQPFLVKLIVPVVFAILARTTEVGSRTLVAGVCAGEESHGEFMSDSENQAVASWVTEARGQAVQKKVYEQTMAILERLEPGISQNL